MRLFNILASIKKGGNFVIISKNDDKKVIFHNLISLPFFAWHLFYACVANSE